MTQKTMTKIMLIKIKKSKTCIILIRCRMDTIKINCLLHKIYTVIKVLTMVYQFVSNICLLILCLSRVLSFFINAMMLMEICTICHLENKQLIWLGQVNLCKLILTRILMANNMGSHFNHILDLISQAILFSLDNNMNKQNRQQSQKLLKLS